MQSEKTETLKINLHPTWVWQNCENSASKIFGFRNKLLYLLKNCSSEVRNFAKPWTLPAILTEMTKK